MYVLTGDMARDTDVLLDEMQTVPDSFFAESGVTRAQLARILLRDRKAWPGPYVLCYPDGARVDRGGSDDE